MRDGVGEEDAPLVGHSTWDVESSSLWRIVQSLPPLPVPKRDREGQARLGILCSILFLGVILLPPLHAMDDTAYLPKHLIAYLPFRHIPPMTSDPLWVAILYCEGVVIVACIFGIMVADPCTIKRMPETCLPIPPLIADKLRQGETVPFTGVPNIEEHGRVYCVRCLVWREQSSNTLTRRTHHCNTCQVCCSAFDHHCVFFGRCIAGRSFDAFFCSSSGDSSEDGSLGVSSGRRGRNPLRGNLPFFHGLLAMTFIGVLTCAISPKATFSAVVPT